MIRPAPATWKHVIHPPLRRVRQRLRYAPRSGPAHARYPALDHARFLLITLVVTGHLLEQLASTGPLAATLYRWIYLFHMPAFVLISGALSKPDLAWRRIFRIATHLLLPYVLFQALYTAWNAWLFGGTATYAWQTPYWLLWYLPSLACWRLLLPLFARVKFALPLAVAIALAAGLAPAIGYPWSLSRTLVFLPLFLLGHRIGARRLQHLGDVRALRGVAVGVLAAAAAGAWTLRELDPEWLYAAVGYAALDVAPLRGVATRLALLTASAACALAVLSLVPRRAGRADLGRRSLTAYLMHGFLIRALLAAGVFGWLAAHVAAPAAVAACVACGGLIAAALSTRLADRLAAPLTRPLGWIRGLARLAD